MSTLKAPFNFVPLNEQVYIPDWADQISQDIPFSDGLSGTLDLTITAETPIFVSDEHPEKDKDGKNDNNFPYNFCKAPNDKYFIPATTLKGCIRSVMEILSFGKMTQFQDQSFGIRDLNDQRYRNKLAGNVKCGWLSYNKEENKYSLDRRGKVGRISLKEIDGMFGTKLSYFYEKKCDYKIDANKTAKKKYEVFNQQSNNASLDIDDGTIVLTGQPSKNKKKDFIFPSDSEGIGDVPIEVINDFKTVHANSDDYTKFRADQLRNGEPIPVFYTEKNGQVEAIGLSYMFKFPAYNSVANGIPIELQKTWIHDLCECVFGYTDDDGSLKGRVQFTTAFGQGKPKELPQVQIALATPHPSYYPLYLGDGQTWNSSNVKIAGRKRYPTRTKTWKNTVPGQSPLNRYILPLDKGTKFCSKIHFHNLRPVELGALIAAITFCGDDKCFHNIGQAKPLGYGKVKMEISKTDIRCADNSSHTVENLIDHFKTIMNDFTNDSWKDSDQLKELFAMAEGIPKEKESEFEYMQMSTNRNNNEFITGKNDYNQNGTQLGRFTQIINETILPKSKVHKLSNAREYITKKLEEEKRKWYKEAKTKEQKEKAYSILINEAKSLQENGKFEEAVNKAEEAKQIMPDRQDASEIINTCKELERKEREFAKLINEAKSSQENGKFEEAINKAEKAKLILPDRQDASEIINTCKELERIETSYLQLIKKAKSLQENGKFEEAVNKAEEARQIFPDRKDATNIINACKTSIDKIKRENFFKDSLKNVLKTKATSLGNLIGTTKSWVNIDGNTFGVDEINALAAAINGLEEKERKKFNSKKKELEKAIGKEMTEKVIKELVKQE